MSTILRFKDDIKRSHGHPASCSFCFSTWHRGRYPPINFCLFRNFPENTSLDRNVKMRFWRAQERWSCLGAVKPASTWVCGRRRHAPHRVIIAATISAIRARISAQTRGRVMIELTSDTRTNWFSPAIASIYLLPIAAQRHPPADWNPGSPGEAGVAATGGSIALAHSPRRPPARCSGNLWINYDVWG